MPPSSASTSSSVDSYVSSNEERLLEELLDLLRIPSISTLPEHREDVAKAARFVADSLTRAGMVAV